MAESLKQRIVLWQRDSVAFAESHVTDCCHMEQYLLKFFNALE